MKRIFIYVFLGLTIIILGYVVFLEFQIGFRPSESFTVKVAEEEFYTTEKISETFHPINHCRWNEALRIAYGFLPEGSYVATTAKNFKNTI